MYWILLHGLALRSRRVVPSDGVRGIHRVEIGTP